MYRKAFKNWLPLVYAAYRGKNEKKLRRVLLRNGNILIIPAILLTMIAIMHQKNPGYLKNEYYNFDYQSGIFTFCYKNNTVKLLIYKDGKFNGEMSSYLGDYEHLLPIKDSIVFDIGGNIGDSAVYFAIEGALKVIVIEPYRYSFEMLKQNITLNNLNDKIIALNVGYGRDGSIEIEDKISGIATVLEEYKGGIRVPLFSLESLVNSYVDNNDIKLVLKMDCEGCEYNILNEKDDVISRFSKILIEYHNGYENILNKLQRLNFKVAYTHPHQWIDNNGRKLAQGYLYATKN